MVHTIRENLYASRLISLIVFVALILSFPVTAQAVDEGTPLTSIKSSDSVIIPAGSLSYSPKAGSEWTVQVKILCDLGNRATFKFAKEVVKFSYNFSCEKGDGHISLKIPETTIGQEVGMKPMADGETIGPFHVTFDLAPNGQISNMKEMTGKDISNTHFLQNMSCLFPPLPTKELKNLPYLDHRDLKELNNALIDSYVSSVNLVLAKPEEKASGASKIPDSMRLEQHINCTTNREDWAQFNVVFQEPGTTLDRANRNTFEGGTVGSGMFVFDKKLGHVTKVSYNILLKKGMFGQIRYEYAFWVNM